MKPTEAILLAFLYSVTSLSFKMRGKDHNKKHRIFIRAIVAASPILGESEGSRTFRIKSYGEQILVGREIKRMFENETEFISWSMCFLKKILLEQT